jgi:hypothetical protein
MPKLTGLTKEPRLRIKLAIREEFAAIVAGTDAGLAPRTVAGPAHRRQKDPEHRFHPAIISLSNN